MVNQVWFIDNMKFMASQKNKSFDLAIIDPPYGLKESNGKNHSRGNLAIAQQYEKSNWDEKPPDMDFFKEVQRVSKNQIIFGANHFIENIPSNRNSSCWIVWDKENGETDFADAELAWTSFKGAVRICRFRWAGMLQGNMKKKEIRIHETQKPVYLYRWILQKFAKPGQTILDTNIGSGSIRIACLEEGFDLTGCENNLTIFNKQEKRYTEYYNLYKISPKLF